MTTSSLIAGFGTERSGLLEPIDPQVDSVAANGKYVTGFAFFGCVATPGGSLVKVPKVSTVSRPSGLCCKKNLRTDELPRLSARYAATPKI